jgi:hypothetical protein
MVAQSAAHKAKIAAGLRAYHRSCKGTAKSRARAAVRADNAPLTRRKAPKRVAPPRASVFTRLVDKRSQRGRGPGRKGPAPRITASGARDKRFKGKGAPPRPPPPVRRAPPRPPPPSRSSMLRRAANARGAAPRPRDFTRPRGLE